jgi:hypothetical protein
MLRGLESMSTVREVLCLHAQANDLKFLKPAQTRLKKLLGAKCCVIEFGDQHSSAEARLVLKNAVKQFVVVFAHGADSYIRSGEYRSRTGEVAEAERFLKREEVDAFSQKVVFCLSCDSNGLAEESLSKGAVAFVGFREIPFNRFDAHGNAVGNAEFVGHAQTLICGAVKASLERFIAGKATLDESVDYMRLWICQQAIRFVREQAKVAGSKEIAALFLRMKDGVQYHGESGIRFVLDK